MLDIQVNGGDGLLFNDCDSIDDFLRIEKAHLLCGSFIIPTFITDDLVRLEKFIDIIRERIKLNSQLFPLWGMHIEGFFITNIGTHPKNYTLEFNKENINKILEILKPVKDILPIYFTVAPELIKDIDLFIYFKRQFKNITIGAGHTKITKIEFKELQNKLGDERIKMLTHFHNAMTEGHFKGEIDGIPSYVMEYGWEDGYIGLITDGQHTNNGELLPTLLNYKKQLCIISDATAPACCINNVNGKHFEIGGHKGIVEQKEGELPSFYWIADNGYKTLAGSAVNLKQCKEFLNNLNIENELEKTRSNEKANKLLLKYKRDIKKPLFDNNMFLDNQVKALNISKEIFNYTNKYFRHFIFYNRKLNF